MITTIQQPVTGREEIVDAAEPLAALSQFYRALNSRDIVLMEQNWDLTDEAAMDNVAGRRDLPRVLLHPREAVLQHWALPVYARSHLEFGLCYLRKAWRD